MTFEVLTALAAWSICSFPLYFDVLGHIRIGGIGFKDSVNCIKNPVNDVVSRSVF